MTTRTRHEPAVIDAALHAYRRGWFPMFDPDKGEVGWFQPYERCVIPLDDTFRVASSLAQRVRSARFTVTGDTAFEQVIRECAAPARGREETWLSEEIIQLFLAFHRAGLAHSVEAWRDGRLVGGLYGLAVGAVFCGEAMFSRPALGGTDASKVCLVHLVSHLRRRGFVLLDAQMHSDHLGRFGAHPIPHERYLAVVKKHGRDEVAWGPFEPARTLRR